MTERRAMAAERDSMDRYVAAFMEDRVGATFPARITGVTRFGLFVRLAETGAEGLVPARSLGFEYFRHDEKKHAMIGDRTGTTYRLGDRLTVRLLEAAPLTGGLRFEIVEQRRRRRKPAKPARAEAESQRPHAREVWRQSAAPGLDSPHAQSPTPTSPCSTRTRSSSPASCARRTRRP